MKNHKISPPTIPLWLLKKTYFFDDHECYAGDIEEEYGEICRSGGKFKALRWIWFHAVMSIPKAIKSQTIWSHTMIKNFIKISLRNLWKHRGHSLINIAGLAIGMACCILILLWVNDELKGDRFQSKGDRIYRVIISEKLNDRPTTYWKVTPPPLVEILKNNYPAVEEGVCFRKRDKLVVNHGNRSFREDGIVFTTPSIFSVFTFQFIRGNPSQVLQDPQSIVLTRSMARKYFNDTDPVGKILKIENKQDFTVSGVIEDIPGNSHITANCFVHLNHIKIFNGNINSWGEFGYRTYILLKPGADWKILDNNIRGYMQTRSRENKITFHLQHFPRIYLYSHTDFGLTGKGDIRIVVLLTIIALIILVIACINFINLSTARAVTRSKEIGLRKVVGSKRKDLVFQFFGESCMMALISLFLALAMVGLLLSTFNQISGKETGLDDVFSGTILLGILIITLFTGSVSGIYPAILMSSYNPVKVLSGKGDLGNKDSVLRKFLVVAQFSLSIAMIISTVVIYQQIRYMQTKDLGFNRERLAYLYISDNRAAALPSLKKELSRLPGILNMSIASNPPFGGLPSTSGVEWQGKDPNQLVLFHFLGTDFDYANTLNLKMASGRFFSTEHRTDKEESVVVNETAVKAMKITDPVGKTFTVNNNKNRIIGVIRDFNFESLHNTIRPMFMYCQQSQKNYIILRLAGSGTTNTLSAIRKTWDRVLPDIPFEFGFVDEKIDQAYRMEQRMGKLFVYAALLAILISCLGLLGLASFTACQKRREICIRKVLGASIGGIVRQLSVDFSKWVVMANLVAWPAAYFFMKGMLQNYSYRIPLGIGIFVIAGIFSLALALVTISYQVIKAASANAAKVLKNE